MSGSLFDQFIASQGAPKAPPAAPSGAPDLFDQFTAQQTPQPTAQPAPPSTPEDSSMWKVVLSGLAKGASGFMDLVDLGDQAMARARSGGAALASPTPITGGRITQAVTDNGGIGFPGSQPQTTGQRYAGAAAEGLGGAVPMALLSGGVAPAVSTLVQGVGSGLGAQGGDDLTGGKTWGRIGGSIGGSMAFGGLANLATKAANAALGNRGPVTQAYHEAGVEPRMLAATTGGKTASVMQDVAGGIPGGTGRMQSAANQTLDEFGAAVNKAADTIGGAATPQAAGEAIQTGAKGWLADFAATSADKWNKFWQALPPDTQSPLTATRQVARGMGEQLEQLPGMADALSTDQWKGVRQILMAAPATVDVSTLKALRTAVGEQLENAALVGNPSTGDMKRLYGAITEDIKAAAVQKGAQNVVAGMVGAAPPPQISPLAAFTEANDYTRAGHQLIDHTVSKIFDKSGAINPEMAYNWAIQQAKSGDTRFNNLREVTDAGANAAAGAKLRTMAQPAARSPGELAGGPVSSPAGFNTAWNQLSPEGRQAMFSGIPNANALATVAGREAMARGAENTSRTAHTQAYMDWLKGAGAALGGGVGALAGHPVEGAGAGYAATALGMPAIGASLARVMTSPTLNRVAGAPGAGLSKYQISALAALLAAQRQQQGGIR